MGSDPSIEHRTAIALVAGPGVGEPMSAGWFAAARRSCRQPLIRWALTELLRDEARHGPFGVDAGRWLTRNWPDAERRALWPACVRRRWRRSNGGSAAQLCGRGVDAESRGVGRRHPELTGGLRRSRSGRRTLGPSLAREARRASAELARAGDGAGAAGAEAGAVGLRRRAGEALEQAAEEAEVVVADGLADVGDALAARLEQVASGVDAQAVQVAERRLAGGRGEATREVAGLMPDAGGEARRGSPPLLEVAKEPILRALGPPRRRAPSAAARRRSPTATCVAFPATAPWRSRRPARARRNARPRAARTIAIFVAAFEGPLLPARGSLGPPLHPRPAAPPSSAIPPPVLAFRSPSPLRRRPLTRRGMPVAEAGAEGDALSNQRSTSAAWVRIGTFRDDGLPLHRR